jgi:hypothetical protein
MCAPARSRTLGTGSSINSITTDTKQRKAPQLLHLYTYMYHHTCQNATFVGTRDKAWLLHLLILCVNAPLTDSRKAAV